jgi:hypothetical protein
MRAFANTWNSRAELARTRARRGRMLPAFTGWGMTLIHVAPEDVCGCASRVHQDLSVGSGLLDVNVTD